jgi:hypothetical protein
MKAENMKKLIATVALVVAFASSSVAQTINNLGAGRGSVIGTDLFPSYQGANPAVRPSAAQIAAYVYGLASGDLTSNGTGTHTLATVNANVGTFGSATSCITTTQNAKGLTTAISAATCTPAIGSITGLGTGVATQLATAVSTAGGSTQTIAAGATALGTTLITSGSCATVLTVAAANVASTDTIMITPNASIKAVTGYAPVTTGGLQITPYPTAGNVNFDQCNPTNASVTPGAVTINWRVVR